MLYRYCTRFENVSANIYRNFGMQNGPNEDHETKYRVLNGSVTDVLQE